MKIVLTLASSGRYTATSIADVAMHFVETEHYVITVEPILGLMT